MPLCFQSALQIAAQLRHRQLSAVECLEYFRARVERLNPALNAIIAFDWERADESARRADQTLAQGRPCGPLHGVPMTIKESFDVAGLATTWGERSLSYVAERDDLAVERLRAAGAVIFGKTNVPRMLLDFQSYNDIYGVTNNPWDLTRTPGGSSGGAAAALAAGLTSLELGSDIGGSIRNPAHYSGVFGHKPTFDIVATERLTPPPFVAGVDLAVAGPLARSAEDLELSLRLLIGPGSLNRAVRVELPEARRSLREYRVALWPTDANAPVQREIADRCQSVGDRLAALGVKVSDKARPAFSADHAASVYRKLLSAGTNGESTLSHRDWLQLDEQRTRLRLAWRDFFREWDIVLCPIAASVAFEHLHGPYRGRKLLIDGVETPYFQQLFWAGLATCSYLPSTVFPTGVGTQKLPIGLQAIGDAYADLQTIEFARLVTQELGGFQPPPGLD
ncbi:MAG TPA: amidase family protein [Steroidobacteraceae bacterium]|nr:amidase family protein [Steroidobacteraceae bacterium]